MEARREFDLRAGDLFASPFLIAAFFTGARLAGGLGADDEDPEETAGAARADVEGLSLR